MDFLPVLVKRLRVPVIEVAFRLLSARLIERDRRLLRESGIGMKKLFPKGIGK
jgi:hypothetical protein